MIAAFRFVSGEEGRALGFAFRDMVLDQEVPPDVWPLDAIMTALSAPEASADDRAGLLVAHLSILRREIDRLGEGAWEGADAGETAVSRAA